VVTLTLPAPIADKPYLFPNPDGTGTQQAMLTANFPDAATYRIRVEAVGRWNAGTGADYKSKTKVLDIFMNVLNIQEMRSRFNGQGAYAVVPDLLVVSLNDQVEFQAVANPNDIDWPDQANNKPEWSSEGTGVAGATGKANSVGVSFDELGEKTVTATYGNAAAANILVADTTQISIQCIDDQQGSPDAISGMDISTATADKVTFSAALNGLAAQSISFTPSIITPEGISGEVIKMQLNHDFAIGAAYHYSLTMTVTADGIIDYAGNEFDIDGDSANGIQRTATYNFHFEKANGVVTIVYD